MKKLFNVLFIFISILYLFKLDSIYADELDIYSEYAILYNMNDDTVIYDKNPNVKTSIASLTKIMTCIVAIENIDNLDEKVTLNWQVFYGLAEANASVAGFRYGDVVTYRDLLMGALLPSGADATRALALNISGSEENFVKLMNNKAAELNLQNTHFDNTTGLESANHYSTVSDISILLKYALKNEIFKDMYMIREYTASNGLKFYSTLKKISNNYTIDVSNILGSKTGYTNEAGLCMSSIANYNDVDYLLVTAGADYRGNTPRQLLDAITIYGYFSKNYSYQNIITKDDVIEEINVKYSDISSYQIKSPVTIERYLSNSFNFGELDYVYDGLNVLSYKNKKNDKIGVINVIHNDEVIETIDVYLIDEIEFNFFNFVLQTKLIYPIIVLFCLIIFIVIKLSLKKKADH